MLSGGSVTNSSRAKLSDIMVAVTIVSSSLLQNLLVTIMADTMRSYCAMSTRTFTVVSPLHLLQIKIEPLP
jgi:hypothetical protein